MATGLNGKDDVNVGFGASTDGLLRGIGDAVRGMAGGAASINSSLASIIAQAGRVRGAFGVLAGAVAGGKLFKEALQETMNFGVEIGKLSRRFDLTARDASVMAIAIDDAYLSVDEFNGAASQLNRQLRSNEEGLKAMGIATRDQNGKFLDQKTLLFNTLTALREYKAGTDQNLAASIAFGRGMDENMLNKLFAVQEGFKETGEAGDKFGRIMGVENVQSARDFKQALKDSGDGVQGMQIAIGNALMPAFTNLLNIFTDAAEEAIPAVSFSFKVLSSIILGVTEAAYGLWQIFKAVAETIGITLASAVAQIQGIMNGDFDLAPKIEQSAQMISESWSRAMDNVEKKAAETKAAVDRAWNDNPKPDEKVGNKDGRSGAKSYNAFDKNAAKDQLEEMKKQFALLKQSQGDYMELTKEQEVEFWAKRKDIFKRGSKEWLEVNTLYLAARRAAAAEAVEIERANMQELIAIATTDAEEKVRITDNWATRMAFLYGQDSKQYREAIRAKRDADREYVQQQKSFADMRAAAVLAERQMQIDIMTEQGRALVSIGAMSAKDQVQLERDLSEAKYRLQIEDLDRRRTLYADDVVVQQQLNAEKIRIDAELQKELALNASRQQAVVYDSWSQMLDGMFSTLANVTQGLLQRTMTWKAAMQNVASSLLNSFVQLGVQRVRNWVITELTMTGASKAGDAARIASAASGSAATVAAKGSEATTVIAANAAEAASGAAASQASIPYIGPILAVAAAASILAFVMGLGGGGSKSQATTVPSAAGGWWDVPGDTMAKIHEREMVMPAPLAEGIRNVVENGGVMGGSKTPIVIQAVDAQGVERLFRNHGDKLMDAMMGQYRNNPRMRN